METIAAHGSGRSGYFTGCAHGRFCAVPGWTLWLLTENPCLEIENQSGVC